ncbi:hypothetical protein EYF80_048192 [Liparis tanakae]|uniref:Uncharacterized protein n=1 Tax=Liparis tanakae TaxID=230148 RepID=A0A4Z2FMU7_9TELE|nr:hypothetical protein EYF80_048192 [Liparis tanakae]
MHGARALKTPEGRRAAASGTRAREGGGGVRSELTSAGAREVIYHSPAPSALRFFLSPVPSSQLPLLLPLQGRELQSAGEKDPPPPPPDPSARTRSNGEKRPGIHMRSAAHTEAPRRSV